MNHMSFADLGGCAVQAGYIFIRRCGKPVEFKCAECGLPLCGEHAGQSNANVGIPGEGGGDAAFSSLGEGLAMYYCPTCLSRLAGTYMSDSDTADNWDSHVFNGNYSDLENSPFTEEDYAAFDAVSDYDKDADVGHGYDS